MATARPVLEEQPRTRTRLTAPPDAVGHPFEGLPQVGTLFWTDGNGADRFCGATVVRSPHHNLVIGAGHCLLRPDPRKSLSFVPQYHDGLAPHGVFPVEHVYIDPRYAELGPGAGARWDYAVLKLAPRPDGMEVEDVVGGFTLAVETGFAHAAVRLIGYPGGGDRLHPQPLDCLSSTHVFTSSDPGAPATSWRSPAPDTSTAPPAAPSWSGASWATP